MDILLHRITTRTGGTRIFGILHGSRLTEVFREDAATGDRSDSHAGTVLPLYEDDEPEPALCSIRVRLTR